MKLPIWLGGMALLAGCQCSSDIQDSKASVAQPPGAIATKKEDILDLMYYFVEIDGPLSIDIAIHYLGDASEEEPGSSTWTNGRKFLKIWFDASGNATNAAKWDSY